MGRDRLNSIENIQRDPNYPDRLSANELHDSAGHAYSLTGEKRQAVACWISEHLPKFRVCQTIESIVLVDQKNPA